MGNPVQQAFDIYKTVIPSPLINALLWGSLSWYGTKKILPRIPLLAGKAALATQGKSQDINAVRLTMAGARLVVLHPIGKTWIPIGAGSLVAALLLAGSFHKDKPGWGMFDWDAVPKTKKSDTTSQSKSEVKTPLVKQPKVEKPKEGMTKTLSLFGDFGYQPSFNFQQTVPISDAANIFKANPLLTEDPYIKHFGTSIITAAPLMAFNTTSLGNIYDSAVNKFLNKLEFSGLAKAGLKGMVSASLAGMFTDTIGTVMGLPSNVRAPIVKSTALGSALYSILK